MALLTIVTYGSEILKTKAKAIPKVDGMVRTLARDMCETLHVSSGLGLAAPQVNKSLSLFVVNAGSVFEEEGEDQEDLVIINPVIKKMQGSVKLEEGCLSVPGIKLVIERAESLVLEYIDINGKPKKLDANGLFAQVIQHETDHLNGVLIVDRISALKRKLLYKKRLDEIEKKAGSALSGVKV
jgi:peptide deformylase